MRRRLTALTLVSLVGCVSEPGVVPAGQDTFMASRAGKFYVPMTELRAKVLQDAGDFCEKRNMTFSVISSSSTQPPYLGFNYPEIEVQFRCVSHNPEMNLASKPTP